MALTLEQEQALLALLDEQKLTLSELDCASELNGSDLMLVRQGILDKSLKGETLKRYVTPPAASLTTSGLTKLSSAVNSSDEGIAATSKAVKSAYDLAGKALMKESNLADLTNVADALTNLGLGEAAARNGITASDTANGWLSVPAYAFGNQKNLVLQWGTVTLPASPEASYSGWQQFSMDFAFPIAFPGACLSTACSLLSGGSSGQWVATAQTFAINKTGARALVQTIYPGVSYPSIQWIAVGF
ncbi:phage tail protein [Leminorella grimontii]|uniref:phage tail protein n=1 Tax=Leminorella grimontii TaxID=82981 RepID=UPI00321FEBA9